MPSSVWSAALRMNRMFHSWQCIVAMNRRSSKWVDLWLKHSSVQCIARRRVYVSMLSSTNRFVSGDLPLTKWLLICMWQSETKKKMAQGKFVLKWLCLFFFFFCIRVEVRPNTRQWKKRLSEHRIPAHLSLCSALFQWTPRSVNFMYLLRRLVVLRTWALNAADYKFEEERERIPLFLLALAVLMEAQRKTQWVAALLKDVDPYRK